MVNIETLGRLCKQFRESKGFYQSDVAEKTGYSKENVSAFECGRNNNAIIFSWYVSQGFATYYIDYVTNERGFNYGKNI